MEKRVFEQITTTEIFKQMLTVGLNDTTAEFRLIEDGTFELDADELFNALVVLNSSEFEELIEAHNYCEEREDDMREALRAAYIKLEDGEVTSDDLYNVASTSRCYGRHAQRIEMLKNAIQYATSWRTWTNACKLYESLTGIPREWL